MSGEPSKRRRVKTGCLNCRKKHKKCDEIKPTCSLCRHRSEPCQWPQIKILYKSTLSNNGSHFFTTKSKDILVDSKKDRSIKNYSNDLMNTLTESSYEDGMSMTSSNDLHETMIAEHEVPPGLNQTLDQPSHGPADLFHEDSFLPYNDLHDTLRDFMLSNASTSLEFQVNTPSFHNILNTPQDSNESAISAANKVLKSPVKVNISTEDQMDLKTEQKFELLQNYIYEVAPWLDMFDGSRQFGSTVPHLAKESSALINSIYAISSRQLENTVSGYPAHTTMKLYRIALRSLIPTVNNSINIKIVTACVLLCVFEMMSSSPHSWRRHLEGCAALFKATGINGFSDEFKKALFWCYARMDVDAAVIGENSTIIPSREWLPKVYTDEKSLFVGAGPDMYANYSVFLSSKVLNLGTGPSFDTEWESLWFELNDWWENRPPDLQQILDIDMKPFPLLLYANGPAISANQLYHMANILMVDIKPRGYKFDKALKVRSTIWHAKQIVAISLHNPHHGCWNNALQPLWVAGKVLSGDKEQKIILELLNKIEKATGWIMKFRAMDLQKYWSGDMV